MIPAYFPAPRHRLLLYLFPPRFLVLRSLFREPVYGLIGFRGLPPRSAELSWIPVKGFETVSPAFPNNPATSLACV